MKPEIFDERFTEKKVLKYSLCKVFDVGVKKEFFIEPAVFSQLESFSKIYPEKISLIIDKIFEKVSKNNKVYMASDFENPIYEIKGIVYLELADILDNLNIYVEDKSRPSDYGD